jgi:hypothetical protein
MSGDCLSVTCVIWGSLSHMWFEVSYHTNLLGYKFVWFRACHHTNFHKSQITHISLKTITQINKQVKSMWFSSDHHTYFPKSKICHININKKITEKSVIFHTEPPQAYHPNYERTLICVKAKSYIFPAPSSLSPKLSENSHPCESKIIHISWDRNNKNSHRFRYIKITYIKWLIYICWMNKLMHVQSIISW